MSRNPLASTFIRILLALAGSYFLYAATIVQPAHLAERFGGDTLGQPNPSELAWARLILSIGAVACLSTAASARVRRAFASRWFVFALPIAVLALVVAYKTDLGITNRRYVYLIHEDGPAEYATFLAFTLSALVFLRVSITSLALNLHLVFAGFVSLGILLLWVAMEEISYGQRVFGWETPGRLKSLNTQAETNLHNIGPIQSVTLLLIPRLIGLYGTFGWLFASLSKRWLPTDSRFGTQLACFFPPWFASSYFALMLLYMLLHYFAQMEAWFTWLDQEPAELFVGLGFLIFALTRYREIVRTPRETVLQSVPAQ